MLVTEIIVLVTCMLGLKKTDVRHLQTADCRTKNVDFLTLHSICKYSYFHYRELTVNSLP